MKRSLQEVVELVVFGLVALLVGTAVVWVLGWVLSLGGALFKALAGLLWLLLRFIVPIAIVAGLIYFLVKALQGREGGGALAGAGGPDTSDLAQSASREAVHNVQKVVDEMGIDAGREGAQDRGSQGVASQGVASQDVGSQDVGSQEQGSGGSPRSAGSQAGGGSQEPAGEQRGSMPEEAGEDEIGDIAAATGDEGEPQHDRRAATDDESRGDPDENA